MSDEGEIWEAHKAERKAKKADNEQKSLAILRSKGFEIETLNESVRHYRVQGYSFWPSTGKFYNPKTGEKGRGVFNLIKKLK